MALNRQPNDNPQDIEGILEPTSPETAPELVDGQPQTPAPEAREPRAPQEDDRLTRALQTIEGLQREVADLRGRPPQIVQDRSRDFAPQMEMIEVLPGRSIPKDPSQRAIKLRAEDLVRMGWNEDPAQALNALANAFFHQMAEVIPAITFQQLEDAGRTRSQGMSRQDSFFKDYPDLKDFPDLANIVEQQAMQELPIQSMSQNEWNREVGSRVRQRIASMRGISLDQYTSSLAGRSGAAPRPRAVTSPPARGGRQAPSNDQQREIDDLLEGRL